MSNALASKGILGSVDSLYSFGVLDGPVLVVVTPDYGCIHLTVAIATNPDGSAAVETLPDGLLSVVTSPSGAVVLIAVPEGAIALIANPNGEVERLC